jgi:uncharacterized DUF497 family protein
MEFEWDGEKNATNIRKQGFDFADGQELFDGKHPFLVAPDCREDYGEERWQGIGMIRGRIVVAVFTERSPGLIRFIFLTKSESTRAEGI